jgi:hypothetical protein
MTKLHRIRLSNYEKLQTLGTGRMGKVYQVRSKQTQLLSCVKLIHHVPTEPDPTDALETLVSLSHRTLLPVTGYALPDKKRPLVLFEPYVSNGSLFQAITDRRLISNHVKMKIIFGVAEGMRYLESVGHRHGGLTLHNVLLTDDCDPVISDYGVAQYRTGAPPPGLESDVRAYGLIVLSLLAKEVVTGVDVDQFPTQFPISFQQFVRDCLSADAAQRPTFESIVVGFLTNNMLLPLFPEDLGRFREYQGDVLHPTFSGEILFRLLDQLRESKEVHARLMSVLDAVSGRLGEIEEALRKNREEKKPAPMPPPPPPPPDPPPPAVDPQVHMLKPVGPRTIDSRRSTVMHVRPGMAAIPVPVAVDRPREVTDIRRNSMQTPTKLPDLVGPPGGDQEPDEDAKLNPHRSPASLSGIGGRTAFPFVYQPFDGMLACLAKEQARNAVDLGLVQITGNSLSPNHATDQKKLFD